MPAKAPPRIIVVDTNCFVRLFMSELRPLLGVDLGGFKLLTLAELAAETTFGTGVASRHPWIGGEAIQRELKGAALKLRQPKAGQIDAAVPRVRRDGNRLLAQHCKDNALKVVRELSLNDARAFVTADELDVPLATDEWPLRLVAQKMGYDQPGQLLTSVELIHRIEDAGCLTKDQRVKTVRDWILNEEPLTRGWEALYKALFGEDPPEGQLPD